MIRHLFRLLILTLGLYFSLELQAQTFPEIHLSNQARVSLLVCEPKDGEIFELYGHVGIRVLDPAQGVDVTFNYGIFRFSDDFAWRFVRGHTDYMVVPQLTQDFIADYHLRGSQVEELQLSLPELVVHALWNRLSWNVQPENSTYRYNYFYDNCSTRPLSIILSTYEQVMGQPLALPGDSATVWKPELKTWREAINYLEAPQPWLVLGTDIALGMPTDGRMSVQERTFAPQALELYLSQTYLPHFVETGQEVERPQERQSILAGKHIYPVPSAYLPVQEGQRESSLGVWPWLLLVAAPFGLIAMLILVWRWRLSPRWDLPLFLLLGVGGSLLAFIAFFSEHPHVFPNLNLLVFHPLHLLILCPLLLAKPWGRAVYRYHFANFVTQCTFIVLALCGLQHIHGGVYLLSALVLMLSLVRVVQYNRLETKGRSDQRPAVGHVRD